MNRTKRIAYNDETNVYTVETNVSDMTDTNVISISNAFNMFNSCNTPSMSTSGSSLRLSPRLSPKGYYPTAEPLQRPRFETVSMGSPRVGRTETVDTLTESSSDIPLQAHMDPLCETAADRTNHCFEKCFGVMSTCFDTFTALIMFPCQCNTYIRASTSCQ